MKTQSTQTIGGLNTEHTTPGAYSSYCKSEDVVLEKLPALTFQSGGFRSEPQRNGGTNRESDDEMGGRLCNVFETVGPVLFIRALFWSTNR
jgi:hypothetical protein